MGSLISTGVPFSSASRGVLDQLVIERLVEPVVLRLHAAARDAAGHLRDCRGWPKGRCPWPSSGRWPARVSSMSTRPTISSKRAEAQLRHVLAHLLGDEEEEIDDVLGRALELRAQRRILRGDAHRAGVQVALAHHDAAHGDQRRGGEAELLGAQQRGDGDVAAGLQLAVGLHADAAAQVVHHQHLLRFGEAQFPGNAGVLDGTERRSAGAAAIAARSAPRRHAPWRRPRPPCPRPLRPPA